MTIAAVLALLVVHNLVTNLWAPPRWYVPVNLLVVLGVVALVAVVPRPDVATGGLFAPALVHAAANSGATVAAYLVLRSAAAEAAPEGVAAAHLPPDVAAEHAEQQPS